MRPKFANLEAWHQAEILMQPAFIRLIDNLTQRVEASSWHSSYQDVMRWDEEVCEETRGRIALLQQELKTTTSDDRATEIQAVLAQLPSAYPSYELCLTQGDRTASVDIWDLCYQICFRDLDNHQPVTVDRSLLDEVGQVDWIALDEKTKWVVETLFTQLDE
ncbi:MAG: hypothetical protein VKJ24_01725 [Synechococcales bacterium]|nr:hypothetical protein [Synechococcales bacterium]